MQGLHEHYYYISGSDEEIFTREQRFMHVELREYLDQVYE